VDVAGPGGCAGCARPGAAGRHRPARGGRAECPVPARRICKRDGQLINVPELAAAADDHGFPLYQKLTVYTSEAARHDGQPIHRAIVRRLRSAGISGATAHRGIWGFHGDRPLHGDRFLQLARHVPTITTVIDAAERIFPPFDIIDELTKERGLVTSQTVPAMRAPSGNHQ
jgi:PII-like signaling protein